jgi:penicillin-binding protein 2
MAEKTPGKLPAVRVGLLRLLLVATLGLLGLRLAHIQFVRGAELKVQARNNSIVPRAVEADRGVIYDNNGRQVVFNRPRFAVGVVTAALPTDARAREALLDRLAEKLEMPRHDGVDPMGDPPLADASGEGADGARLATAAEAPSLDSRLPRDEDGSLIRTWEIALVARNVPRDTWFRMQEDAVDMPGVLFSDSPVREYPAGPSLAHLLGFTGSIPAEELAEYRALDYAIFDSVGRDGLELTYEAQLRGEKGQKYVEVDASGREVRRVGDPEAPRSGNSLRLTLNLDFQRAAEAALARGLAAVGARSGAVVALDPRSGAVRALVSLPNYDNNMFSTGAKPEEFAALLANPDRPLINRAVAGQYAPGSTYKMITAAAALQEGVLTPSTRISCPGTIYLTNQYNASVRYPFVCWQAGGHGSQNVVGALAQSCDVFFYEAAGGYFEHGASQDGLGSERLAGYARQFGLGEPTGIELLGEGGGRVPTAKWLAETLDEYWGTGQTYIMGIGQGFSLATPLQMANVVAAVANGGTLYKPHLVEEVVDAAGEVLERPGGTLRQLAIDPANLALVRQGMLGAVQSGTARSAWTHLPSQVKIAGKTGTAEFCDYSAELKDCRRDKDGNLLTHAWFASFAPYENPEIALIVFIDGSGLNSVIQGSQIAAPVAAEIYRAYFKLPSEAPPATATPCDGCPTPAPGTPAARPIVPAGD